MQTSGPTGPVRFVPGAARPAAASTPVWVRRFVVRAQQDDAQLYENVYVVGCRRTRDAVLMDPGTADSRILEYVRARKLRVHVILNTHGHWDHIGGNGVLARALGAPVWGPALDRPLYALAARSQRPTHLFRGGGTLILPSLAIAVIPTPGHSPGSTCFRVGAHLLSGDTLFRGSVGRTWGSPAERRAAALQMIRGIRQRLLPLGDPLQVHPGHGDATTLGRERRENPFLRG